MQIGTLVQRAALYYGDAPCLTEGDRTVSFREFDELTNRLANALQDLRVEYDYTVRDATGKIVQFNYGEDNIDVSKSEKGRLNVKKIIEQVGV